MCLCVRPKRLLNEEHELIRQQKLEYLNWEQQDKQLVSLASSINGTESSHKIMVGRYLKLKLLDQSQNQTTKTKTKCLIDRSNE